MEVVTLMLLCYLLFVCGVEAPHLTHLSLTGDDVAPLPDDNSKWYTHEGSTVSSKCEGVAVPPAMLQWKKDGETIESDGRFQVTTSVSGAVLTSVLQASNVQRDDEGMYTCNIVTPYGSDGDNIDLVVAAPMAPIIYRQLVNETVTRTADSVTVRVGPEQVFVVDGQTVKVDCNARGQPNPVISWTDGDRQVGSDGRVNVDESGTLEIREFSKSDEGQYRCLATNTHGTDSETIDITRAGKFLLSSINI